MDRLFVEPAAERRRFLDRLTLALRPDHAQHANRYEAAMRARNRLLTDDGTPDMAWLTALEAQMAEHGVCIDTARRETVTALSERLALLEANRREELSQIQNRFNNMAGKLTAPVEAERELQTRRDVFDALDTLSDAIGRSDTDTERSIVRSILIANETRLHNQPLGDLSDLYLDVIAQERLIADARQPVFFLGAAQTRQVIDAAFLNLRDLSDGARRQRSGAWNRCARSSAHLAKRRALVGPVTARANPVGSRNGRRCGLLRLKLLGSASQCLGCELIAA